MHEAISRYIILIHDKSFPSCPAELSSCYNISYTVCGCVTLTIVLEIKGTGNPLVAYKARLFSLDIYGSLNVWWSCLSR